MAASTYGSLGKVVPTAATDTVLYTVPAGRKATLRVHYANRNAGAAKVRVGLLKSGQTFDDTWWIAFDRTVNAPGDGFTPPIAAGAGDVVYIRSDVATVNFQAIGIESDI